jgi:1A family penicillin-binding protein
VATRKKRKTNPRKIVKKNNLFKIKRGIKKISKIAKKISVREKKIIISGLVIFVLSLTIWDVVFKGLPTPAELVSRKINVTTKIYDRNGVLLYQIYKDQNRTLLNFSQIPENIKLATIASEDASFYTEHGFSLKGILRAMFTNITNKKLAEGGSTITQQLVKNTLLSPEKTIIRKIKELVLAIKVEATFSKDKILEMYLNQVSYGGSAYGIEAASEQYFGKDVSKLDLAESALLVGLPKSPTTYSPFGENPDLAIKRQKEVLQAMVDNKYITKQQQTDAEQEKLNLLNNQTNIKAPHFVMYVRQKLVDEYGEDIVNSGGLNVFTTLDYNVQQIAQEAVTTQVNKLKGLHVGNGAALVVDPNSGEILAMVGSKDYFDTKNDGNVNVTVALRPPGSSIKIVNYAYALSHGYTPASIISDEPITFKSPGADPYSPVNYDGKFVGNIRLRDALAESRNIPAVKLLASYGVQNMIELGQKMGITTWNQENTYGLSLTLGGGATKLIDLTRVFATVADYGNRPPIISITKVTDYKGNNLPISCDTGNCDKAQVLDPRTAFQLIDILKDNNARAPEFGQYSSLVVARHPEVAVKTGTSNSLRDNLTIGFNQKYLAAVWVGNNDNSSMSRIASGITGAAPIWNEIMAKLLANEPSLAWKAPSGLIQVPCPNRGEWFLIGTNTKSLCKINVATTSADFKPKAD